MLFHITRQITRQASFPGNLPGKLASPATYPADDQGTQSEWLLDAVSKRDETLENGNPLEVYSQTDPNTANGYSTVLPALPVVDPQIDMSYDQDGRLIVRELYVPTAGSGSNTSIETYRYGAHSQVTSMDQRYPNLAACPKGTAPDTALTYTEYVIDPGDPGATPPIPPVTEPQEVWTYRYSESGVREQRRLMQSSHHDSVGSGCSTVFPWTYYVNDPSGLVLAVYHGRQEARTQGEYGETLCNPEEIGLINPLQQEQNVRRVYFYPVEYRSYGLTGVNVVYERDPNGDFVKRFITLDDRGSAVLAQSSTTLLNTYDTEQDYLPFGMEVTAGTRRTGWLDREVDWETSPLDNELRTTDLVHRKYTPHTGSFNAPDPLWMLSVDASSYHYGRHDPVNTVDPWGLDPGDPPGNGNGGVTSGGQGGGAGGSSQDAKEYGFLTGFGWLRSYYISGGQQEDWDRISYNQREFDRWMSNVYVSPPRLNHTPSKNLLWHPPLSIPKNGTPWVDKARSQIGVREIKGPKQEPKITEYFQYTVYSKGASDDEVAWCGAFVNWSLNVSGGPPYTLREPPPERASGWLAYGVAADPDTPPFGSIAVIRKNGQHHVGFVVSRTASTITLLGGNQNNEVNVTEYEINADRVLLGVRYPIGWVPSYEYWTPGDVNSSGSTR